MEEKNKKRVMNLIIVDESGSMGILYDQALAGMNETITTCKEMQERYPELEQRVMLVTFDSGHYKLQYDNLNASEAKPLTKADYVPSGGTPLYDAIGKSIARMNAITKKDDNVLVTIITDGMENCSGEYTRLMVKNLIEKQKEQGWTITLIGTDNLDVEGMAHAMSIDHSMSWKGNPLDTERMFSRERASRMVFCASASMGRPVESYFVGDDEADDAKKGN